MRKRNLTQIIPSIALGMIVIAGLKFTTPVFDEIKWPEPPELIQEVKAEEVKKEPEDEEEIIKRGTGNYEDGIYTGQGVGFSGNVQVQVAVEKKQITSVEILSHSDTPSFFQNAMAVIDRVLAAQTWEVDAISGATYSSRGILEGIRNALTGEKSTSAVASFNLQKADKAVSTTYEEKGMKDGTYTGSAQGFGGKIKVQVKIKDGKIVEIKVLDHSKETPSFFWKAEAIIQNILNEQTPNVDTISGATYSSNGIREAVKDALKKAGIDEKETQKKPDRKEENPTEEPDRKEENPTEEPDKKGEDPEEKTDGEEDYSDIRLNRTIDGETVTYLCNSVVDAENAGVSYLKGLFENYHITVKIVFKKQKLKEFKISDYDISDEVSDGEYYDDISYSETALSAIYSKLQKNPNADIDAVSGATCSSTALIRVYKAAARDYKEYLKTLEKEKPLETPDEKAPDEKVPDEKEADEKTPEETSPDEKVPDEKVPDEKVPDEKEADEKTPEETSPDEKAPDEKAPDEKVPDEESENVKASDDKKSGKRIEENRIKEAPVSEERAEVES